MTINKTHSKVPKKSFLENGFPLDEIQLVALKEGNSKRPVYQIHKWWARRLGSVFRGLLMSSFLRTHVSYRIFKSNYYNGFRLDNPVIYDPMMGGGTSIVEALKLGCKVVGCDINPVAWFVTKKEVDPFDEDMVDMYYDRLEQTVSRKIKKFYETTCPNGHECESVYALWIRHTTCRNCHKKIDLFNNLIIRHDKRKYVIICPKCDKVGNAKLKGKFLICKFCKGRFEKDHHITKIGVYTCPSCGESERIVDNIKRIGKPLESKMFCIEYSCEKCGRGFKSPTKRDLKQFENIRRTFAKHRSQFIFPKEKIPRFDNLGDKRPVSHGFRYFYELFNPRQLLSLSLILQEIKKIPDENTREFLLLTFSSSLETNNVFCKYETEWGKISALFGMPAYHIPERWGENNVWGKGRGSFPRTYLKMKRGKKYAQRTYELLYNDKMDIDGKRKFTGESIVTEVSTKRADFKSDQRAFLYCQDSSRVSMIKSKSVDAVVTDPPYFDTIRYSRLADFFYVWLRLGLKDKYPWFRPETSKRVKEIVADEYSKESRERFVSNLTKVFQECHRVLKDNGIMIFTFHHTQKWAWSGLREAIKTSSFHITATPIIRSEGRTGFRKGSSSTGYDACIVCRKSEYAPKLYLKASTISDYLRTIKSMQKIDDSLGASDVFTIIMSKYLGANDATANKIMENTELLISKLQVRARIKNN